MKIIETSGNARALLEKYRSGKCSPEEIQQVLQWYYAFGKEDDIPIDIKAQRRRSKQLKQQIFLAINGTKRRTVFGSSSIAILRIAAILVLFTAAGLLGYWRLSTGELEDSMSYMETSTIAGQRKIVSLSDGSKIWLNNESKLKFPKTFAGNQRQVYLSGEAFFEVAKDTQRPFVVSTAKLNVKVLGTSFNIKAFADERKETVSVSTGKVAVAVAGKTTMQYLLPGEQSVYEGNGNKLLKTTVVLQDVGAWQNNSLVFREATLEEICRQLERWYGMKIVIANQRLLQKRFTLRQQDENLDNVLKILSIGEFSYQIEGKTVTIK